MARRWFIVSLLLTLCAAVLPAAGSTTGAAPPITAANEYVPDVPAAPLGDFMGMVARDPHYEWGTDPDKPYTVNKRFLDEMGKNLRVAGVRWVRIEIFAEEFDLNPDPDVDLRGMVDVAKYDYFINTVAPDNGLKVLALLATPLVRDRNGFYQNPELLEAPSDDPPSDDPLACGKPENGSRYPYGCGTNTYMRTWLENALTVANAFPYKPATSSTKGSGIAAFEVLNEENRYLNGGGKGLKPESVATLLTKFYRVHKQGGTAQLPVTGNRDAVKIILGGIHPDRCDDCTRNADGTRMNDRQYLNAVYKSSAFQHYAPGNVFPLDGVGYHPYPTEMQASFVPEGPEESQHGYYHLFRIPQRLNEMRNVMVQNGDLGNKLWITEMGDRGAPALSGSSADPALPNEGRQADFLRQAYWMLWLKRASVENVFWFKYEDFAVPKDSPSVGNWNFGLVRLVPRPSTEPCAQPIPVPDPASRQSCDYSTAGTVQHYKLSYNTYQTIAEQGFNLYRTRLPIMSR